MYKAVLQLNIRQTNPVRVRISCLPSALTLLYSLSWSLHFSYLSLLSPSQVSSGFSATKSLHFLFPLFGSILFTLFHQGNFSSCNQFLLTVQISTPDSLLHKKLSQLTVQEKSFWAISIRILFGLATTQYIICTVFPIIYWPIFDYLAS